MDNIFCKNQEEAELEICIKCGTLTTVKKTDNVTHRHYYIEGAGQLCFKCGQRDKREVEHAQKLWNSIID